MAGIAAKPAVSAMDALNRINPIVSRYCESQMLFAAWELGVFEALSAGPQTPAAVAAELKLHPDACYRLLIGLAQLGLVERHGETFSATEISAYLTRQSPVPLHALSMWGSLFYPMWGHVSNAIREGAPQWQQTWGVSQQETFANLYRDPVGLRKFCGTMNAYSIPQGRLMAEVFDFAPYRCVLDVAGGPGGMLIEIARKYAHLRGIVMDLPPVCALAEEAIQEAGMADRLCASPADLFAGPYPQGADAISLSWILHDWNDDHCRAILRNCHAALPENGTLLITESVLNPDHSGTPFSTLMSLHMLVLCEPGARERTESEYRALLEETGFRVDKLMRLDAPRDLLIARKAKP